jgi:hypothetical protein
VTAATAAADKPTTKPLPPAPYSTKRKYKPKSKKTAATAAAAAADTDADVATGTDGATATTASGSSSTAKDTTAAAVAEVSIMSRTPAGALKRRRNATDVLMVRMCLQCYTYYLLFIAIFTTGERTRFNALHFTIWRCSKFHADITPYRRVVAILR